VSSGVVTLVVTQDLPLHHLGSLVILVITVFSFSSLDPPVIPRLTISLSTYLTVICSRLAIPSHGLSVTLGVVTI
jgi:hypothetical protein